MHTPVSLSKSPLCRIGLCLFAALLLGGPACTQNSSEEPLGERTDAARPCTLSSQCPLGERCSRGLCEPRVDCSVAGCAPGELCGPSLTCMSPQEACDLSGGCSCAMVNMVGQLGGDWAAAGLALHRLAPGEELLPQTMVQTQAGQLLPSDVVRLEVLAADRDSFSVQGDHLVAGPRAGRATLQLSTPQARCTALVENLGPSPAPGSLQVFAFDAHTGAPVAGAQLVVDLDRSGTDAGLLPPTDAAGLSRSTQALPGAYSLSVFADAYDYLSLVDLDPAQASTLRLPLYPRQPQGAGSAAGPEALRRQVDFTAYEQSERDGASSGLHAAVGGTSLPLGELLSTSLSLDLGGLLPSEQTADLQSKSPSSTPQFSVEVPGMPEPIALPVPACLALTTDDPQIGQSLPKKPELGSQMPTARRLFWALGGEFGTTDLLRLSQALHVLTDAVAGLATGEAGAPTAAPRQALEALVGLLPKLALGLADAEVTGTESIALRSVARRVRLLEAPTFPLSTELDTLMVLSGVDAPGYGFVPTGFGLGADCLDGACMGERGAYTHVVKGVRLCTPPQCPVGVPARTADGQLALFGAAPFNGLEQQPQVLAAVALSSRSLLRGELELSAVVDVAAQAADLQLATLPKPPILPAALLSRQLSFAAAPAAPAGRQGMQLLRLSDLEDGRQWHILSGPAASALCLPAVPPGGSDLGVEVGLTQVQLELDAPQQPMGLSHLAGRSGGLSHFGPALRRFALRSLSLPVE
jgi:hypothetical protein